MSKALVHLILASNNSHHSLKAMQYGFHISKEHSYIGASPDALVPCDCCSKRVPEVKCPFSHKSSYDINSNSALEEKDGKATF